MIQIHIIVYETDEGAQRFKVMTPVPNSDELLDVSDQYVVAATVEEKTGRNGFIVLKEQGELNGLAKEPTSRF